MHENRGAPGAEENRRGGAGVALKSISLAYLPLAFPDFNVCQSTDIFSTTASSLSLLVYPKPTTYPMSSDISSNPVLVMLEINLQAKPNGLASLARCPCRGCPTIANNHLTLKRAPGDLKLLFGKRAERGKVCPIVKSELA
jgi:hypothetical protein